MKLWFEDSDNRGCPSGWMQAKNVAEAIELIKAGEIEEMSLDHDIDEVSYGYNGSIAPTGTDLVYWMLKNLPPMQWPHTIRIHSMNRSGAERMAGLLDQAAPKFVRVSVRQFYSGMIKDLSQGEKNGSQEG